MSKKFFGNHSTLGSQLAISSRINKNPAGWLAAILAGTAGLSHLALIPEHEDVLILAAFFVAVGLIQLALGGLFLLVANKRLYKIGILSSASLIILYFATRFIGIPIGHYAEPEPIDGFGLFVKLVEGALFIPLLYLSRTAGVNAVNRESQQRTDPELSGKIWKRTVALVITWLFIGMVFGVIIAQPQFTQFIPKAPLAVGQNIREYTLIIEPKQMKLGDKTWEVWTYNGTVPAPTLKGKVGDTLRITLINKHNMTHSLHTHLPDYKFEMDGSQANIIAGKGAGSMVPPGGQYVYEYPLTTPGIYYYHCHSSDGGRTISEHIHRGLYGAIIVDELGRPPPAKEFVLFYSDSQPGNPAPFTINNRGIPGGEMTLMEVFKQKGFAGVAEQLNVTVTAIKVQKDDVVRIHVINIGDVIHSHHQHGLDLRSVRALRGDPWPAAVLPLVPGQADTLEFRAAEPGLWLIHCHVVSHADAGMIAVLIVG